MPHRSRRPTDSPEKPLWLSFALTMTLLLASAWAQAAPPAQEPDALTALAREPYWHQLLRDRTPDDGRYLSPVTQTGFFLSPDGARDAAAELRALVSRLNQPATNLAPNDHPACRFPARVLWLRSQLPLQAAAWPQPACPDLDTWLQALDTAAVTLVFASDYLNNPSSMFGHTLLRLDARTQTDDTRLLAYAINYSAQTATSNGLEFAVKGLTGGYPGKFSLLPYYEKVKEYNDWESRDLWEYELDFTPDEVRRLVLTQWEWQEVTDPYFFLSRNCSYALLGLIEMARPGLRLQNRFPVAVIPSDTLRVVIAQPGLLKRITWRPASGTRLAAAVSRNDRATNRAAVTLAAAPRDPVRDQLTPVQAARAYEVAYDDLYSRHVSRKADADAPARLRQLLTERSRIAEPDQRVILQRPVLDPSQGHDTARWGLGWVHDGSEDAALIHYRPAYHDWLDANAGYREGARIDFLSSTWRAGAGRLTLQEGSVVAIDSLAPADGLRQPLSWSVRLGADRALGDRPDDDSTHGMAVFEGGGGLARRLGSTLCHAQSHSDARGGRGLDRGWEVGAGARLGCIGGGERLRWLAESRHLYRWPVQDMTHLWRSGLHWSPAGSAQALRLEWQREWRDTRHDVLSLQWLRYF